MSQQLTKADWENYLAVGRVPDHIRSDVLQSWRRSAQHRIAGLTSAPVLSDEQLLTQQAQARRLRGAARNALDRAGHLLEGTGNILLLCDRSGVVLDEAGDGLTLARARENHLHLGGTWSEAAIGTNAIGTALHLGRAVEVRAVEHFCEEIQRWNCSATPITDPGTGRILGVLDISWPTGTLQKSAGALSGSLALQVEAELTRILSREREALMERLHLSRLRRGNEPMLAMDRCGADVLHSENFAQFCDDDAALRLLRERVPDLIDQTPDTLKEALSDCMPGTDVEVVTRGDEAIGVVLSLRRPTRRASMAGAVELEQIGRGGQVIGELCAKAGRLARAEMSILLEGETGVGKTFLARAIHRASPQAGGPFVLIDCAELSEEGLRADLAAGRLPGGAVLQGAEPGALCLNSPGASCAAVQKLLLRLAERVEAQGWRVISLSTRDLYDAMTEGQFRGDLYYRIAVARLKIPPLRARRDEIGALLRQMSQAHASRRGRRELRFTSAAMERLKAYGWPGNLREMKNLIVGLDALSMAGLVDMPSLPPEIRAAERPLREETLRDGERAQILEAVAAESGNLSRAARRLGIARSTLYLKLDSYGIGRRR